ncbi:hypothetical protein AMJ80_00215 [bacterium SM23_31]|nr:MAG: hypothetical protein AMJ80_00215 [bacterium SM23_31]
MNEFTEVLVQSYNTFFQQMAAFLPSLIGAILILIIGWIIAKIFRALSIKFLKLVRFNVVTEKAKVDKFLEDGGVKKSSIEIIGSLFYWLIMLIVILTAFNSLGLSAASALFNQVFLFIPNIIVAVLVLILGLFLANFISQALVTYLKNIEIENAESIGKLTNYAIIVFVISLSLTQLDIGKELISNVFLIVFSALCLAMALAFGIGGKEWAAGVIDKYFKK